MDSTQEQLLKRKLGGTQTATAPKATDVFDQLGNELLLSHVAEARSADQGPEASLLASLLGPEAQVAAPEEDETSVALAAQEAEEGPEAGRRPVAPGVELEKVAPVQDRAEAERLAAGLGVDPVLVLDPEALGTSELAKQEALGEEGEAELLDGMKAAAASLGAVQLGGAAEQVVVDQVREQLEVRDIVEARREDRMDELVQDALRTNALRSRDEVILLLQRLATTEAELQTIAAGGDPAGMAVQLIEYLATMLVELDDLYALAAYDHGDILERVVLSDEALTVDRKLSPLALRMGGFSAVLYQMVVDDLAMHPMADVTELPERDQQRKQTDGLKPRMIDLANFLRLARTAAV